MKEYKKSEEYAKRLAIQAIEKTVLGKIKNAYKVKNDNGKYKIISLNELFQKLEVFEVKRDNITIEENFIIIEEKDNFCIIEYTCKEKIYFEQKIQIVSIFNELKIPSREMNMSRY